METIEIAAYRWANAQLNTSQDALLPALLRTVAQLQFETPIRGTKKIFKLGCGNGSVAKILSREHWEVTGVDPSNEGVAQAKIASPHLNLQEGSAYDDVVARFGHYPITISLEVVEHVYSPRKFASTLFDLLESGGTAIISTPYHAYIKNLDLALSGKLDAHFTALWDHVHIKFWSRETLGFMLEEFGLIKIRFERVGRIPALAMSIIAVASKP